MKYEFHPNAEAEFLESVGFYESKVKGLGSAFIDGKHLTNHTLPPATEHIKLSAS